MSGMKTSDKKINILLVDDERELCEIISEQLENDVINCDCTFSGEDAIERLKSLDYNVLISDINMPGMTGLELVKRAADELDSAPDFYLLTGYTACSPAELESLNVIDVFQKPDSLKAMIEFIQSRYK